MSFFNNRVHLGSAIWAVGILQMVSGLNSILFGIAGVESLSGGVLVGIGAMITGFIYAGLGSSIRVGAVRSKWDVLCMIMLVTAVVILVNGVFSYTGDMSDYIAELVIAFTLAPIVFLVYLKLTRGNITFLSKVIFYVTIIVYWLLLLSDILSIVNDIMGIMRALCKLIVDLYILMALRDPAIQAKFGVISKKKPKNTE